MELWYTEKQTEHVGMTCKTKGTLLRKRSPYQEVAVIDTEQFGRMLLLDGIVQTTVADEFVYHEMIAHVPLNAHPNPRKVAVIGGGDGGTIREIIKHDTVEQAVLVEIDAEVIGGGDGGTIREIIKHDTVEKAVLVEIDAEVIEASRQYLPEISCGLDDERVEILITDGIEHIREAKNTYDVIIIDSTDPVGPAVGLFSSEFYGSVYEALKDDGIMVAQTESPYYEPEHVRRTFANVHTHFPITKLYLAYIPSYSSGLWGFTIGAKKHDPAVINREKPQSLKTRYYNADVHKAAFALPEFVRQLVTS